MNFLIYRKKLIIYITRLLYLDIIKKIAKLIKIYKNFKNIIFIISYIYSKLFEKILLLYIIISIDFFIIIKSSEKILFF